VDFPEGITTVITPKHTAGVANERAALVAALENPIGCAALQHWLKPDARVCISFSDITRATPNDRIIPWLLNYLAPLVRRENITLLNSLGTHRPSTPAELERQLGAEVVAHYRVVDNEPNNDAAHVPVGVMHDGTPALLNRHFVTADVRIVTGFIEPHFFAGFSGGPKGIMPGVAHLRSIMSNHDARNIGHPNATFGRTDGNPLWEEMRDVALRGGPAFLLNVTLNDQRQITGVFAGDLLGAHRAGTELVRQAAMQAVPTLFDIVVTTNSGYPLDLNLYQGVKGMSAAARIIKPGGLMILACECSDGLPPGSAYERLLHSTSNPEALLQMLAGLPHVQPDQWQVQIQGQIQQKAEVLVYSTLPDEAVRAAHLQPCHDIAETIRRKISQSNPSARIAVLPQGPLTIPYVA
jgi:nickel-dependent lactate racemase